MINDQDYRKADLIVTMDDFNFSEVNKLAPDESLKSKIRPFCDFVSSRTVKFPTLTTVDPPVLKSARLAR